MIEKKQATIIAGQILIEKYGRKYIEENKKRLATMYGHDRGKMQVHFDLYKNDLDKTPSVEKNGGIYVEEKDFPDRILSVEVDLRDGSAKIIED